MCERYALPEQLAAEREFVPKKAWWKFSKRFNVSGRQNVPSIRLHEGESEAVMMSWGLIPSWTDGQPPDDPALCVDIERMETSVAHRLAWQNSQRCILPLAGFYAWRLTRARYRQPYFVRLLDRSVFGLAAIWDRWVSEDDDVIESCSLVCVPANDLMREIANAEQHMPAILKRKDYDIWLHGGAADAKTALRPYRADAMQAYPVSPRVNSAAADDRSLIRPIRAIA
jgi:putative SOS response-associated peptidase YedK